MKLETDEDVLERWRAGDEAAGSELFRRHVDKLYRFFCNKVAGNVDDLVQETLLACCESEHQFDKRSTFRAFLFGVARFKLYAHYRQRKRARFTSDFETVSVFDIEPSPSYHAAENSDQRLLLEALRHLPLNLQIALELSYWEELTASEIGAILELPTDTVYSRLRRARELLKQQMDRLSHRREPLHRTESDLDAWAASLKTRHPRET